MFSTTLFSSRNTIVMMAVLIVTVLLYVLGTLGEYSYDIRAIINQSEIKDALRKAAGLTALLRSLRSQGYGDWQEFITTNGQTRLAVITINDVKILTLHSPTENDIWPGDQPRYIISANITFQVEATDEHGRLSVPTEHARNVDFRVYQDVQGNWSARINAVSLPMMLR